MIVVAKDDGEFDSTALVPELTIHPVLVITKSAWREVMREGFCNQVDGPARGQIWILGRRFGISKSLQPMAVETWYLAPAHGVTVGRPACLGPAWLRLLPLEAEDAYRYASFVGGGVPMSLSAAVNNYTNTHIRDSD